ncbi:MAG TPA: DNA/RNA non-specific endonuclease, partial [Cellvibrionaceae bacterium]|nr:DNA/RNA non-specific endonuclease [Cellvibrionaceae bacterium]
DYEDTKEGAIKLVRSIDKKIDGFDNREADRTKEKIRSELAKKYSPEVVEYFMAQGEVSGLFTNIGKINSGFYNSADQSIDTLVNLQLPGAIDNSIPNVVSEDIPGRIDEVQVTAPKDTSLGVVVSNTTADLARIVNEVPEDRKSAANDFYTLLTGGPFGFVTNKAIEKGVSLLPQTVLQSLGEAGEKVNETIGRAGTGVLLGVNQDQVKESQTSGNERTQDRVDGAAMVGGAALDVTVGVVAGGVAIAVAKAKKAKASDKKGSGDDSESGPNRDEPKNEQQENSNNVQIAVVKIDSSKSVKGSPEYEILNDPTKRSPNTRYELDSGTSFTTNENGFVDEITFTPENKKIPRDSRQTAAGKEGRATDVGGHIQACTQGGSCDGFNLFPQDANFNNSSYKVYYENVMKKALKNPDAEIGPTTVRFTRADPKSPRPDELELVYQINGKTTRVKFLNEANEIPEIE